MLVLGRDGTQGAVVPHRAHSAVGLGRRPSKDHVAARSARHGQGRGLRAVGALGAGQADGWRVPVGQIVVRAWRAGGHRGAVYQTVIALVAHCLCHHNDVLVALHYYV